ncbi:hypothetical protein O181_027524 [Austropuccinia psidii MF-1]|uniref:Glycoside hydrolase 131 catalytic N-terminal domain-containing protein n=1 Tax=Austropuccinia psidii MF-1 TaxID=1389203 RepID=A0A9Q3H2P5_9BASI|nr:hypothetical protein [Austropuccinia psidii MF-1]
MTSLDGQPSVSVIRLLIADPKRQQLEEGHLRCAGEKFQGISHQGGSVNKRQWLDALQDGAFLLRSHGLGCHRLTGSGCSSAECLIEQVLVSKAQKLLLYRLFIRKRTRNMLFQQLGMFVYLSAFSLRGSYGEMALDYRIPANARVADLSNKASPVGKLTKALLTGGNKPEDVFEFQKQPKTNFSSIIVKINDKSIFQPNRNDNKSAQVGFRRTDIVVNYDAAKLEKGKKTYHHSIQLPKALNNAHGYLLASVEYAEADGAHIYDIHYGTQFDSKDTSGKAKPEGNNIRVRDVNFQELFSVKADLKTIYNFAIEVDWDKSTLQVYHSTNDSPLKLVKATSPNVSKNPKAAKPAGKCEWHIQMIKEPLPDPKDPEKDRSDVPHKGIQESGINEEVVHLRDFIEDTTKDPVTLNPDGLAGKLHFNSTQTINMTSSTPAPK